VFAVTVGGISAEARTIQVRGPGQKAEVKDLKISPSSSVSDIKGSAEE
jgi:hypothetical protein